MQTDDLIVVAEFTTSCEAELAKAALVGAGIHAEVRDAVMADIYPCVIAARLMVSAASADETRQLLHLE